MMKIAILLIVSWNKILHDDPPFLIHFLNIYNHIFHLGKFQGDFNFRSKMVHLPLRIENIPKHSI